MLRRGAEHRRFLALSLGFAAAFGLALLFSVVPTAWVLAIYVTIFAFYGASFARGAIGEDE